ncbi:MAG: glycosyltransferase family 2 protein [Ginsengibacter sp.]
MNIPKISVITVVYNGAKTIQRSIESVLGQTFTNLELLIIDGGSTDGTIDILKEINSDKVRWTSENDKGIYDAMNKGIQKASGEWIFFLGDDDHLYDSHVLESIFSNPGFENTDLIYGNIKSDAFKGLYDGEFNYEKLLNKNISHQSIFYHKNVFVKTGFYNLNFKTHADWDFNLRCFENKEIQIKYANVIVAEFGMGGVSSNYDLPFLRESLLPRKLAFLKLNMDSLTNIKQYDEWWRFLRNSGVRNINDFKNSGYDLPVPAVILSMVKWQNKLPETFLRKGLFSKITMFANYIVNINKVRN